MPEIDRLIEEGLTLYGQGDLDGALLVWEQALAIDPENPQAKSYVDYVRVNYELLSSATNGVAAGALSVPFGIAGDEDLEYQIEIIPGELEPGTPAPLYMDPADEGWFIDGDGVRRPEPRDQQSGEMTLELEADEPSDPGGAPELSFDPPGTFELEVPGTFPRPNTFEPPNTFESAGTDGGVSFEDATREYPGGPPAQPTDDALRDFDGTPDPVTTEFGPEATPGFGSQSDYQTPPGFNTQETEVRRRELGFVKPSTEPPATVPASARAEDRPRRSPGPPELKMTLRTPAGPEAEPPNGEPADPEAPEIELTYDAEPDPEPPTIERRTDTPAADDLISSLPSPRPAPRVAALEPAAAAKRSAPRANTEPYGGIDPNEPLEPPPVRLDEPEAEPEAEPVSPTATTRDLPPPTRPPAFTPGASESQGVPVPTSPTRDFSQQLTPAVTYEPAKSPTRDFEIVTKRRPGAQLPPDGNAQALISAPTRDLGLRERAGTEDEPTSEAKIANLRRGDTTAADELTSSETALPFDPIDARSAQILDDIDEGAPEEEEREDRTRRRITALFEKASEWGRGGDLERAVAAVDLALSEDPNSTLTQKLIHRNRDTVMNVFQAFLGDLQRQPQLARPLHELAGAPISPRAAFLLSRVDGQLSLDEILDVSGMPRLEAYRYLCQLYLRGILR